MQNLKQRLTDLAILVGGVSVIVALVIVSGVFPVKASDGHWAATEAVLQFASKRSIQTNSLGIETPPLDKPEMLRLGAATYASNCAWCHGSPTEPHPVVPSAMLPQPPHLTNAALDWEPRELFYIVKHGIMMTGMPAWPTQDRDEEIWPLVAFVIALGKMEAAEYRELLSQSEVAGTQQTEVKETYARLAWMKSCLSCHGEDGGSVAGDRVPELQHLSREYISMTMNAMRDGSRPSGIMQPVANRLSESQVGEIAEYFSTLPEPALSESIHSEFDLIEEGIRLVKEGDKERKIPACFECHGRQRSSPSYPSLIGQSPRYVEIQLALYADKSRRGGEASVMHDIADKLSEVERKQVAAAFEALQRDD